MTLHLIDHLLVLAIAIVFPILDFFSIRDKAARIRDGETGLRMRFYRQVIRDEWLYLAAVTAAWFVLGRSAAALGLVPAGGTLAWVGYGLTALLCGLLWLQARSILGRADLRAGVREELGPLGALMPHTPAERRGFDLVSVSAGIGEELVFRGFITAYLMALFGVPFWAATIGSSALFGFAHLYQGPKGALRAGAVGLIMSLLYGLTGSLWAPMLAHAVMDLTSGRIALGSLGDGRPERLAA